MTAYESLAQGYWRARIADIRFRQQHEATAATLIAELRKSLAIPDKCFAYLPIDQEPDEGTTYSCSAASAFRDNGWFETRFRIVFAIGPTVYPQLGVRFAIQIRKAPPDWMLRTFPGAEPLTLPGDPPNPAAFTQRFEAEVAAFLTQSLESAVADPPAAEEHKRIGFHVQEIKDAGA